MESANTFLDSLLEEQRALTAVERFSQFHEEAEGPMLAPRYRELIPLSEPGPGEQYSFEVDLEACTGCKACATACHSLNGLDEGESWRDVGAMVGREDGIATQQTVTSACHHCLDPACANGCPTLAYEKDDDTGVVRHLDDQCIGCQYCTMTCPYDVPKYNDRLGIVRKCDMCHERLREGEAPACVQACPNEAIRIRVVRIGEVEKAATVDAARLLPGTAPSAITRPTTKFLNLREGKERPAVPADHDDLVPAPAHGPLAAMLVLTQAAAGMLLFDFLLRVLVMLGTDRAVAVLGGSGRSLIPSVSQSAFPAPWHGTLGAALAVTGLGLANLHLGRPLQAWRSFLGWRKSWLSREILVFGPWAALSLAFAASLFLKATPEWLRLALGGTSAATGLLGVYCSVMVYVFTRRPFWSFSQTGTRFALTGLGLGLVFVSPMASALLLLAKMIWEIRLTSLLPSPFPGWVRSPFPRSARLLRGPLQRTLRERFFLGGCAVLLLLGANREPVLAGLGFAFAVAAELRARQLFFQAVEHPKMPGGIVGKKKNAPH